VQRTHSATEPLLPLPEEWGLQWWRSNSYRVVPLDAPESPVSRQDAAAWRWAEGVFWTEERGTAYDPMPHAAEIFDAALHVAPDDVESLLAFVRAWGVLGGSVLPDHSVWASRRAFRELQRHFAWAQALHHREWRSAAVPALWDDRDALLDALRVLLPPPEQARLDPPWQDERWPDIVRAAALTDRRSHRRSTFPDPYVAAFVKGHLYAAHARSARPRDREEQHWRAFGWAVGEHLRLVNPAVDWSSSGPRAAWEVPRLLDLLWVQLWNIATGGAAIRQCRHCRRWFPVDRRGKVYCSRICTNRASAKASYEARKTKARRTRR
jgi:hypothetical protein